MTDQITGGEAVYRVLKSNGISTVFGLLGGSMLELYDALYKGGEIAYVVLDERQAHGRCLGTNDRQARRRAWGAGRARGGHNVTAVAEAHLAYSPLVVIAGALTRSIRRKIRFRKLIRCSSHRSANDRSW